MTENSSEEPPINKQSPDGGFAAGNGETVEPLPVSPTSDSPPSVHPTEVESPDAAGIELSFAIKPELPANYDVDTWQGETDIEPQDSPPKKLPGPGLWEAAGWILFSC